MKFWRSLHINSFTYYILTGIVLVFVLGYFVSPFFFAGRILLLLVVVAAVVDFFLLFHAPKLAIERLVPDRLSNGDENKIEIRVRSYYIFETTIKIIDELPFLFQERNFLIKTRLKTNEIKTFPYTVRPTQRGIYNFGRLNVFATSPIGFFSKRYISDEQKEVAVYPSFLQMHRYELLAISHRLSEAGIKKIRRRGHMMEFDQIREYVKGDDYRTINWKATARKNEYMVNQYEDEKSQQVYCIIDMGRSMKMPFEGLTLLDYAINASLVVSNTALLKNDKAGLITFTDTINTFLPAHSKKIYMQHILEALYKQTTNFLEPNYELLYSTIHSRVNRRSLLLLYTNFEGIVSLKRQLPLFRLLAKSHLLVVVFFQNTELNKLVGKPSESIEDIYIHTIAEKLGYEKRQIVNELRSAGIHSILAEPQNLTVASINKYLELKALGKI